MFVSAIFDTQERQTILLHLFVTVVRFPSVCTLSFTEALILSVELLAPGVARGMNEPEHCESNQQL